MCICLDSPSITILRTLRIVGGIVNSTMRIKIDILVKRWFGDLRKLWITRILTLEHAAGVIVMVERET